MQLVWVYTDKEHNSEVPDYFHLVKFESKEYYREMATSAVWVFNLLMPQGTFKRDNQLYIQTWHGDKGFKRWQWMRLAIPAIKENFEDILLRTRS